MTTNNQQDDKMRAAFEAAYERQFPVYAAHGYKLPEGGFAASGYNLHAFECWELWQAALASREQPVGDVVERIVNALDRSIEAFEAGYSDVGLNRLRYYRKKFSGYIQQPVNAAQEEARRNGNTRQQPEAAVGGAGHRSFICARWCSTYTGGKCDCRDEQEKESLLSTAGRRDLTDGEVDRLTKLLTPTQPDLATVVGEWMPIDANTPRDKNKLIWLQTCYGEVVQGYIDPKDGEFMHWWNSHLDGCYFWQPVQQPLPKPPQALTGEKE